MLTNIKAYDHAEATDFHCTTDDIDNPTSTNDFYEAYDNRPNCIPNSVRDPREMTLRELCANKAKVGGLWNCRLHQGHRCVLLRQLRHQEHLRRLQRRLQG